MWTGFATAGWTSKVGEIVCGEARAAVGRASQLWGGSRTSPTLAQTFPATPALAHFRP